MTTERNAQGVDGLAEVMGLLGKANFDELSTSGTGYLLNGKRMVGDGVLGDKAEAIAAAVNYLRSHGEAIRELVEIVRALQTAIRDDLIQNTSDEDSVGVLSDFADAALAKFSTEGQ